MDQKQGLDALTGKTVVGLDVSDEEVAVRFRCADAASVVWTTYGDCCSQSWWADGLQLNALRDATVRSCEALELPDYNVEDGRTRQESDCVYGFKITTDKGVAVLAFRNSSKGYYGGDMELGEDSGYEWREIAGNEWSA